MLQSTVSANFRNLNQTFGSFSGKFSHTWTSATSADAVLYVNGSKRFMPLEANIYVVSKTLTVGGTITIGNAAGASTYFSYSFTSSVAVGAWSFASSTADGASRTSLTAGGSLWVRIAGQNPSGNSNTITVKVFVSGYFR